MPVPVRAIAYRATQATLAPGGRRAIAELLRPSTAGCTRSTVGVDIGCGPRSVLATLGVRPVGIDRSAGVAAAYARASGPAVVASATALPIRGGSVARAWCVGALHHRPDDEATAAIAELRRITGRRGSVTVFDGVLPEPGRHPLARAIRRLDRGRWMRSAEALLALLDPPEAWAWERTRYAATGLEGILASTRPPEAS
jgi:SAM-dependent methyltransferase